jgi:hypothetical protein
MTKKKHIRLAAAAAALGLLAALVVGRVIGAGATSGRPPAFPAGQHAFPVMGADRRLLRDEHNRIVVYTPPAPGAMRFLIPGRPPTVAHPAGAAGPALVKAIHPTAAQIAALNAATRAADAAAAASSH